MCTLISFIILFIAGNGIGFLFAGVYYDEEKWIIVCLIEILICTLLLLIYVMLNG